MGMILLGSVFQGACILKSMSWGERRMDGEETYGRADWCSCFMGGDCHQSLLPALNPSLPGFSRYMQIPNPVPLQSSAKDIYIFLWCRLFPCILSCDFIFVSSNEGFSLPLFSQKCLKSFIHEGSFFSSFLWIYFIFSCYSMSMNWNLECKLHYHWTY